MSRSKHSRSATAPRRSAKALVASIALTGLFLYQAGGLNASSNPEVLSQVPAAADDAPQQVPPSTEGTEEPRPLSDASAVPDFEPSAEAPDDSEVSPASMNGDDAEQVARLEKILRANRDELKKQQQELDDSPESNYRRAEQEFNTLDSQYQEKEKARQEAIDAGQKEQAATLQTELDDLGKRRQLAKDRFELEIKERKAANEQVEILKKTIDADDVRLKELLGESASETPTAAPNGTPAMPSDSNAAPVTTATSASASPFGSIDSTPGHTSSGNHPRAGGRSGTFDRTAGRRDLGDAEDFRRRLGRAEGQEQGGRQGPARGSGEVCRRRKGRASLAIA